MSNVMRWRYGDSSPVILPVESATVVEIGDLLYWDSGSLGVKPAVSLGNLGSETLNQKGLHDKFAGVALQRSRNGDATPLRVATRGVFEFDCPSATIEVGALIGGSNNGSNTALLNQQVESVSLAVNAVGRCVQRLNPAGTKVLVEIVSTLVHGGPLPMAT